MWLQPSRTAGELRVQQAPQSSFHDGSLFESFPCKLLQTEQWWPFLTDLTKLHQGIEVLHFKIRLLRKLEKGLESGSKA
jgi:hypothetical protein